MPTDSHRSSDDSGPDQSGPEDPHGIDATDPDSSTQPPDIGVDAEPDSNPDETVLTAAQLRETIADYAGQIEHVHSVSAREADTVTAASVLEDSLADALGHDLYSHQATALETLADGEHVCLSTSTSSGKTLAYALHVARLIRADSQRTALLCYPTKALSRDQERALNDLYSRLGLDINIGVYDGDTPSDRKKAIRNQADLIITNFAGLNRYLNQHSLWSSFFSDCAALVIDESHTYTGVHGMHVSWIIRRLRRLLDHYGADEQLILTSATIGNPEEHSRNLTGSDVTVIDEDGSPRGDRDIVFWEPLEEGNSESPEDKRSATEAASRLVAHLGLHDHQTLMFCRARQQAEIATKQAQAAASDHHRNGYVDIEPYHAGHGKQTRRGTEHKLKTGQLDGVVSTNALELGIDIGAVDATVMTGYPGTRQSFWQQLGRAGRNASDALSILVSSYRPVDQYIRTNPDYLLDDDNIEDAVVGLDNNRVYTDHLRCAANERPLTEADTKWFGDDRLRQYVEMDRTAGLLMGTLETGATYQGGRNPQQGISVYAADDSHFRIQTAADDTSIDIEDISKHRAYREFHQDAVVLHNGAEYVVTDFAENQPTPTITVKQESTNYFTQALSDTTIRGLEVKKSRDLGNGFTLYAGTGTVNITYNAYKKIPLNSSHNIDTSPQPLSQEAIQLETDMMWLDAPDRLRDALDDAGHVETDDDDAPNAFLGGLHAAEHGLIGLAPLELRLDKSDLGGLSVDHHPELDGGGLFIFDGIEGGVGFSHALYESFDQIAANTRDRLAHCECGAVDGCPACSMDSNCGNGNEPLHRMAGATILDTGLKG